VNKTRKPPAKCEKGREVGTVNKTRKLLPKCEKAKKTGKVCKKQFLLLKCEKGYQYHNSNICSTVAKRGD